MTAHEGFMPAPTKATVSFARVESAIPNGSRAG